jgi:hypothetical protein
MLVGGLEPQSRKQKDPEVNKHLIATTAAALVASAAVAAGAQTTVAYTNTPVKIVSYSIDPSYSAPIPTWGGTYMNIQGSGDVTISFVNTGNAPATSVQFVVRSNKTSEVIVDKGTFSPGTNITHHFALDPRLGASAQLEVEQVAFEDGTVWQR